MKPPGEMTVERQSPATEVAAGQGKRLTIVYEYDGKRCVLTAGEGEKISTETLKAHALGK